MMATDGKPIRVYVRLGNGSDVPARELSFRIPSDIDQEDLLEYGFAIDGNSATLAVKSHTDEDGEFIPLSEALHDAQEDLIDWFDEQGYDVVFA
jgi:hypothetical protein